MLPVHGGASGFRPKTGMGGFPFQYRSLRKISGRYTGARIAELRSPARESPGVLTLQRRSEYREEHLQIRRGARLFPNNPKCGSTTHRGFRWVGV